MIVNSQELLRQAKADGCAIPAVNIFNLAGLKAAVAAAQAADCPLIIALAEVHMGSLSIEEFAPLVRLYAEQIPQPIVIHFDHGFTQDFVKRAIDSGFTSVMIDGSSLPYAENVGACQNIVAYAHRHDVSVEGEIGHVGGGESYKDPENDDSQLTTVSEALSFATDSGVDSLAVSVGTAHGQYQGTPKLDFDRLGEIAGQVDVPLVLHGGSGSGDENLAQAVSLGITKVNVFTDLVNAADKAIAAHPGSYFDHEAVAIQGIKECILHYYEVFGTKKCSWKNLV